MAACYVVQVDDYHRRYLDVEWAVQEGRERWSDLADVLSLYRRPTDLSLIVAFGESVNLDAARRKSQADGKLTWFRIVESGMWSAAGAGGGAGGAGGGGRGRPALSLVMEEEEEEEEEANEPVDEPPSPSKPATPTVATAGAMNTTAAAAPLPASSSGYPNLEVAAAMALLLSTSSLSSVDLCALAKP